MGSYYWTRKEDGKTTYEALSEYLSKGKNPNERPYSNNTRIQKNKVSIGVVLHGTTVIEFFPDGEFYLNSGGWKTVTTKSRINEFLPMGWTLWQHMSIWYVGKGNEYAPIERVPYFDGIKLPTDFNVDNPKAKKEEKRNKKLNEQINKYCKKLKEKIDKFQIPDPSNGDCWGCSFREANTGKKEIFGSDHLLSHMKENYFVPSLIINALEDQGYKVDFWWGMYSRDRDHKIPNKGCMDYGTTFSRSVKRYLKRQLGIAR